MKRQFLVPALATALALAVTTPASAQWARRDSGPSSYGYGSYSEVRRIAYERGFREGLQEGEKDGRRRDPFRYQDERDFQRADVGYHRNYGDIERYRAAFRGGFADGYADVYSRHARVPGGRYGDGRYGDGRYGDGRYGGGGYGYPDRGYRVSAFEIGARDGYEKGREDSRENRAFDARRHKWYREGDREYESRYGNREQYKDEYRRGFTQGYDRGYREGRYR